jgi:ribosomal protein S18 acetylase RimI-like enzyme
VNPAVRESTSADVPEIRRFFADLPAEDRTFFYQDVDDPAVIDAWASDQRRIRRCAVDERGTIVALAALQAGLDWTSHVADLVLLVRPDARRQGLGRMMARRMLLEAVNHGFKKVSVMVAADDARAIDMFEKLGFEGEALLRDQLCNPQEGRLRDAVILSHMVDDTWSTMLTAGYEQAVS